MPRSSAAAARKYGAQYTQKLWPVLREYQMNRIENPVRTRSFAADRRERGTGGTAGAVWDL